MSEWEAIAWVGGGILGLIAIITALSKWFNSTKKKIQKETTEQNKIEAYWKKTEANTKALEVVADSLKATANLIQEIQLQRTKNAEREVLKYEAIRVLLKYHEEEIPKAKVFIEKFNEIEFNDKIERRK